jgi:site-specific DNA recombinase
MSEKLRFAPLVRVSTELQEQQGESLNVQKSQILDAVDSLGGIVPQHCWKYSGQEHATPEFEREKFSRLLADTNKGLFDAVIVFDPSRWSRDNLNSKRGIEVLKTNGIRFFVLTTEYDLYSPQATLFLGMSTEMNEYFALEQARKSILARISKAKKGIPSVGAMPYGRTFDRKTGKWGIIAEKHEKIQWAAESYLSGSPMYSLADTLGVHLTTLWLTLKDRCGDTWELNFENKRVGIKETVTMKIPRLLSEATIDAIHQKSQANKTYTHGQTKNRYLLGRVIFCDKCGRTLTGATHSRCQISYYTHPKKEKPVCPRLNAVRADHIEDAVLIQLLNLSVDLATVEKSHTDTLTAPEKRLKLEKTLSVFKKDLSNVRKKKRKLIDLIASGILSTDDAKPNLDDLKSKEKSFNEEIVKIKSELRNIPDPKVINRKSKLARKVLQMVTNKLRATETNLNKMKWEDKRKLVQAIFSGKDINGNRAGVYVRKNDKGVLEYELRRDLLNNTIVGLIPMPSDEYKELLNIFEPKHDLAKEDLIEKNRVDSYVE